MFADVPQPAPYKPPPAMRWLQPVEQLKVEHTPRPDVTMELIDSALATLPTGCHWEKVTLTPAAKRMHIRITAYFC